MTGSAIRCARTTRSGTFRCSSRPQSHDRCSNDADGPIQSRDDAGIDDSVPSARMTDGRGRALRSLSAIRWRRRQIAGRRGSSTSDDERMIINMGPSAPVDSRCAAAHARDCRARRSALQAGDRLPAHRHGEDGRGHLTLPPGAHQRHAYGLRGAAVQRAGLFARGRDSCSKIEIPERATWIRMLMCRAQPDVVAPALLGHQRHGPRRGRG